MSLGETASFPHILMLWERDCPNRGRECAPGEWVVSRMNVADFIHWEATAIIDLVVTVGFDVLTVSDEMWGRLHSIDCPIVRFDPV